MSERLHPDGLPVSATPATDSTWVRAGEKYPLVRVVETDYCRDIERRAREAEARVAELKRELVWLRSGGNLRRRYPKDARPYVSAATVEEHLASTPPEDWEP